MVPTTVPLETTLPPLVTFAAKLICNPYAKLAPGLPGEGIGY